MSANIFASLNVQRNFIFFCLLMYAKYAPITGVTYVNSKSYHNRRKKRHEKK